MDTTKAANSEDANLLFVYGSLMRGMARADFLTPPHKAKFLTSGVVHGVLYDLGAFPGLLEKNNGSLVHGELYELFDARTLFDTLDLIEGYWPEQPERSLYLRKLVSVTTPQGEKSAWAYILNLPFTDLKLIPSGDFRQCAHNSDLNDLD